MEDGVQLDDKKLFVLEGIRSNILQDFTCLERCRLDGVYGVQWSGVGITVCYSRVQKQGSI